MEIEGIAAGRTDIDPREVEDAVRSIDGVAFAEVRRRGTGDLLRLVFWQDVDAVECARRIGAMLYERFGLSVEPGDVRVVGFASPLGGEEGSSAPAHLAPGDVPPATASPAPDADEESAEEVSVIELDGPGGATWATERRRAASPVEAPEAVEVPPAPRSEPAAEPAAPAAPSSAVPPPREAPLRRSSDTLPSVERISVSEERADVTVTVVLAHRGRTYSGQAGGAPTSARVRRAFCEATLRAVEAIAGPGVRLDLDSAAITDAPDRCALAVVTMLSQGRQDRVTGAALLADDPKRALVQATLEAVRFVIEGIAP
jgi:hypothetical protein